MQLINWGFLHIFYFVKFDTIKLLLACGKKGEEMSVSLNKKTEILTFNSGFLIISLIQFSPTSVEELPFTKFS